MGLDINKLMELARTADSARFGGNENGKFFDTDEEVSVFDRLAKAEGFDDEAIDTFKASVKAGVTSPIDNQAEAPTPEKNTNFSTKETSEAYVLKMMEEKSNSSLADVTNAITKQLEMGRGVADNDRVAIEEINKMIQAAGTFNSKEDVEKIHDKLKDYRKIDNFHKRVAKQIEKMAEAEQRRKEYEVVKAAYDEAKEIANLELAYKKVSQDYKNRGSYYKDVLKALKAKDVMEDARELAKAAIRKSEAETSKQVKKDAEEFLGEDYDKFTRKALNGETKVGSAAWFRGEDSDMKIERKNVAKKTVVKNAAEKEYTEEEINKYLGEDGTLLRSMVDKGYITINENGTYNISYLSDLISKNLGGNVTLDKNIKAMDAISETTKTTSAIATDNLAGLLNVNDKQMNKLRKLCKQPKQGTDWGKAAYSATVGAVLGGLAGAISSATNRSQDYKTSKRIGAEEFVVNSKTDLKFKLADNVLENVDVEAINQFNEAQDGVFVETGLDIVTGATIITNVVIKTPEKLVPFEHLVSKMILPTALKSALIGAIFGLLDGLKNGPEVPITSTQFDCTDLETYAARLKNEAANKKVPGKYVAAIIMAASLPDFQKADGSWDCDKFKAWLNKAAGDGGILNREELIAALQELNKVPPKKEPEEDPEKEPVKDPECEKEPCYTVDEYIHERKYGDTWGGIVSAYYPCLVEEKGEAGAVRALKIALSKDENGNIDTTVYKALLTGTNLPKTIKLPKEIDGCQRVKADVVARKVSGGGKAKSKIDSVGLASATDCDTNETVFAKDKELAVKKLGARTGKDYIQE